MADYFIKHFAAAHHCNVRPCYVHVHNSLRVIRKVNKKVSDKKVSDEKVYARLRGCVNIPKIPVARTRAPLVWYSCRQDWNRRNIFPNSRVTKIQIQPCISTVVQQLVANNSKPTFVGSLLSQIIRVKTTLQQLVRYAAPPPVNYTHLLARLDSSRWVVVFFQLCCPTPWIFSLYGFSAMSNMDIFQRDPIRS